MEDYVQKTMDSAYISKTKKKIFHNAVCDNTHYNSTYISALVGINAHKSYSLKSFFKSQTIGQWLCCGLKMQMTNTDYTYLKIPYRLFISVLDYVSILISYTITKPCLYECSFSLDATFLCFAVMLIMLKSPLKTRLN